MSDVFKEADTSPKEMLLIEDMTRHIKATKLPTRCTHLLVQTSNCIYKAVGLCNLF